MKFRINYEVNGYHDSVVLEGDSIEEIRENANNFTASRGLDVDKNNCWSEKLDD